MIRKSLSLPLSLLILTCTALSAVPNLRVEEAWAVPLSPYIMMTPEQTVDQTITPGMNYTIAIYTDYDGSDVWGWQFGLTFNPAILQGIEILNGDLITAGKSSRARFVPGTFDNSLGALSTTAAFFYNYPDPPPTTSGPGTLAYVKFEVVGIGISDLTLGSAAPLRARLQGFNPDLPSLERYYDIIDASQPPGKTEPPYGIDHIGHGSFNNLVEGHEAAVTSIALPTTAIIGDDVSINVTVANEGSYSETFNLTVQANATQVGNQTVTDLASGESRMLTFPWNTTDVVAGNYVINATAWLTDMDATDNNRTAAIEIKTLHDVAILNLQTPSKAIIGDIIRINVTVENQGTFEENVNLTVTYQLNIPSKPPPIMIDTTVFQLAKRPTSETISADWNTTGIAKGSYIVNATLTIALDEEPFDNSQTVIVQFEGHDVAITAVSANSSVIVGEPVTITVAVKNVGNFEETFDVTVTYGSNKILIDTQQVVSLATQDTETLSFTWDTTGVAAGLYTINATAWLTTDVNLDDNSKLDSVVVANPPPTSGNLAGTVTDSNGSPIEGANVTITGYFDTTDGNGHYNITNVPAGTYTVTASKDGYESNSNANVIVTAGQTTTLNFELTPKPQDITLYVAIAVIAVVIIAGIALYVRRARKAK